MASHAPLQPLAEQLQSLLLHSPQPEPTSEDVDELDRRFITIGPLDPYPIRYPALYSSKTDIFGFYFTNQELADWVCGEYPVVAEMVMGTFEPCFEQASIAIDVLRQKLNMLEPYWLLGLQRPTVTKEAKRRYPEIQEEVGTRCSVLSFGFINYKGPQPLFYQVASIQEILKRTPCWWKTDFLI